MASAKLPKGTTLASQLSQMLSAQANVMPNQQALASQFQPIETARSLSNLDMLLYGTPQMSYQSQQFTPAVYNKGGKYSYGNLNNAMGLINYPQLPDNTYKQGGGGSMFGGMGGMGGVGPGAMSSGGGPGKLTGGTGGPGITSFLSGGFSTFSGLDSLFGNEGPKKKLVSPSSYSSQQHNVDAQRGLLAILEQTSPILGDINRAEATRQRSADIYDVGTLGNDALTAWKLANPQVASLLDELNLQAQTNLNAGPNLTPEQQRIAEQQARMAASARGLVDSNIGIGGEVMSVLDYGRQLQNERMGTAGNVATLLNQIYGDPYQRVLSRTGAGVEPAQNAVQQALGIGGYSALGQLNPESQYGQDYFNTRYNAQLGVNLGNAQSTNALIGSGISALGSIAGGALAGGI